jgi:MoaA/NifB/PqqE/SkfB family radical SAM enzyme
MIRTIREARLAVIATRRMCRPQMSRVNLSLTLRCNHKCVTCNIWKNQNDRKNEITLKDVETLLAHNDIMWMSLTGGEPTLNKDFTGILSTCLNRVPLTNVISNGEDYNNIPVWVKKALDESSRNILVFHMSLFGSSSIHNKMTGIKGSFDRQIAAMKALKAIGHADRLILGFEHVISQHNPGEYLFMQHLAKTMKVGLTYVMEQKANYYNNNDNQIQPLRLPSFSFGLGPIDYFKNTFLFKYQQTRKIKCVASQYSCFITPDKNVHSCFFRIPDNPSFNLNDTDFKLKTEYFQKDREFIKNCPGCWTPCESYTTAMFRPWRLLF